jgi:hypothetical protein
MTTDRLKESVSLRIPQGKIEKELVKFLAAQSQPIEADKVYGPLADRFALSAAQRTAVRHDRNEPAWNNLVQQARRRLVTLGYIKKPPPRGVWSLTAAGQKQAEYLEQGITEDIFGLNKNLESH